MTVVPVKNNGADKKLTPMEELFVENYCTISNGVAADAARRSGYADSVIAKAYEIVKKPHVAKAIDVWRENRKATFWISESQLLQRMWEEANNYDEKATHAGRINALVWLGKHMGMFGEQSKQDQIKGSSNTYNIIQYSGVKPMVENAVKEKELEVLEAVGGVDESLGIEIKSYD